MTKESAQLATWDRLLKKEESRGDEFTPEDNQIIDRVTLPEYQLSYERIVTSAAVRALQSKAQVFSLESSNYIRTRLTHSIEVAALAKNLALALPYYLVSYVGGGVEKAASNALYLCSEGQEALGKKSRLKNQPLARIEEVATILETAGLLHDIGNPPFGHRGERVVKSWMRGWCESCPIGDEDLKADLCGYEGNAQAIRLLASNPKLGDLGEIHVMNVVLSSITKYTIMAKDYHESMGQSEEVWKHKPGYYWSEREVVKAIGEQFGLPKKDGAYARHPLAYLLEAADDIAYLTSDFEDAWEMGLITPEIILQAKADADAADSKEPKYILDLFGELASKLTGTREDAAEVHRWVFIMRHYLMHVALYEFQKNYEDILNGKYHDELLKDESSHAKTAIRCFRNLMKPIYDAQRVQEAEAQGEMILRHLLDVLSRFISRPQKAEALDVTDESNEALQKLAEFAYLPERLRNHVIKVRSECLGDGRIDELVDESGYSAMSLVAYYEMRAVLDYVSLLTDTRAQELSELYKRLLGDEAAKDKIEQF